MVALRFFTLWSRCDPRFHSREATQAYSLVASAPGQVPRAPSKFQSPVKGAGEFESFQTRPFVQLVIEFIRDQVDDVSIRPPPFGRGKRNRHVAKYRRLQVSIRPPPFGRGKLNSDRYRSGTVVFQSAPRLSEGGNAFPRVGLQPFRMFQSAPRLSEGGNKFCSHRSEWAMLFQSAPRLSEGGN